MSIYKSTVLAIAATSLVGTSVLAETPSDLRSIVGDKASSGETRLRAKDYHFIQSQKGADRIWSYWWNYQTKTCVSVVTLDGRYDAITTTLPADCNHSASGAAANGDNDSDSNTGVAVAIGAAAILGAVALAHKSHHHDDNKHHNDDYNEAEFERGHRDALYNHSYHNYNDTDAYSDGYESGTRQRHDESSYRYTQSSRYSGYDKTVHIADLDGDSASSADREMRERGFRNVDGLKKDGKSITYWYNYNSHQCIKMVVKNSRVHNIKDDSHSGHCDT